MIALTTKRLTCGLITPADWPFFLMLQQNPQVMRYVADNRSESEIRETFDSRLHPWSPGASHWLCLVVRGTLEKIGFRLEGELRESYSLAGEWHNDWLFGLLSHEYDKSSPSGR